MIDDIKDDLKRHLNKRVRVISKENRNRNEIFIGDVIEIYPHIFVVGNGVDKKSFSYSDILAHDIQITFL